MSDCTHPNLKFYDDGKSIHCVTCMRGWVASPFYPPPVSDALLVRTFPAIKDGTPYLPLTASVKHLPKAVKEFPEELKSITIKALSITPQNDPVATLFRKLMKP